MRYVDLSHTITAGMDQFPGDTRPVHLDRKQTFTDGGYQSSSLEIGCHVGTHIDTPLHFRSGQPGLEAMPLSCFHGRGMWIDATAAYATTTDEPIPLESEVLDGIELSGVDFLLVRTGWERHWGRERYYRGWPTLSPELAAILTTRELKGVGLDCPSADPLAGRTVHDRFAHADLINIENLAHLDDLAELVPPGVAGFDFYALPLKLQGTEASPIRAMALV